MPHPQSHYSSTVYAVGKAPLCYCYRDQGATRMRIDLGGMVGEGLRLTLVGGVELFARSGFEGLQYQGKGARGWPYHLHLFSQGRGGWGCYSVWLVSVGSSHAVSSLVAFRCLLSVAFVGEMAIFALSSIIITKTAATSYPIRSSASFRPPRPTSYPTLVAYNAPSVTLRP